MIVVDASAAISWTIPTQATPAALALSGFPGPFIAPTIFAVEFRNVLVKFERRGLLPPAETPIAIHRVESVLKLRDTPTPLDALPARARAST